MVQYRFTIMSLLLASALVLSQAGQNRWVPPYSALEVPVDPKPFVERMRDKTEEIYLEGDRLTFLFKSKAEKVELLCGLQLDLKKIPATDLWIAQAKMVDWDRAFFNYYFADGGYKMGDRLNFVAWAGPKAPKMPESVGELKGTLKVLQIPSKAMGEDRRLTIYLPPGPSKGLPAIYMADGQGAAGYAKVLEPLILQKKVRPIALIGIHCGEYKGDRAKPYDMNFDFRAKEYLKVADPETYEKSLELFCGEAVRWATKEYGLSNKVEDRAIQGVSNGGAFATTAAVDRPGVFGYAMPFSVAAYDRDAFKKAIVGKKLPKFYFAAGTLESFIRGTNAAHEMLSAEKFATVNESYVSGHDMVMWNIAFLKYVQVIFPAK